MLKIFVSYNPGVEIEQSTSLRLQTLAGLYGVAINLPDRYGAIELKSSTKQRIAESVIFVMFSIQQLSPQVAEEVNYALSCGKTVLVFYDKRIGENLMTPNDANIIEEYFDPFIDTNVTIMDRLFKSEKLIKTTQKMTKYENNTFSVIVGIGLDLILLWDLAEKEKRLNIAIDLFKRGDFSLGQGASFSKYTKSEFITILSNRGIPIINYSVDELEKEFEIEL